MVSTIIERRRAEVRDRMAPGEAFKRGVYFGLGLWVACLLVNIAAAVVIVGGLIALGVVSAAAVGLAG